MEQLPEEFLLRMQEMLGQEYEDFYEHYQGIRHSALRRNPLKIEKDAFEETMKTAFEAFTVDQVPWEPYGYYYDREQMTPGKHPFHEAGLYYIQEPSAMAPVPFLEIEEGDRVLDLCAAPGGKSTQIAGYLGQKGLLVTNEINPSRAKILSENVERLGIANAMVVNESPEHLAELFPEYFDKILVDAPCSGEGMFLKNENAGEEWSPENVLLCAERQAGILDMAAQMLRPGGRLVYSTCTFAPAENEESMARFLERHPEFHYVEITGGADVGFVQKEGTSCVRLWPHKLRGEGHFLAVLQKEGERVGEPFAQYGVEKGKALTENKELMEFLTEILDEALLKEWKSRRIISFGDQIYLLPEGQPSLQKCKVLRVGLHLGTMKKNRLEPSHALALYLHKEQVNNTYEMSLTSGEAASYLEGMTVVPKAGEEPGKGWCLLTVEGYSLGWGKYAGGILKNHYPKGLRK